MMLICSLCGAHSSRHDQTGERCGNCGSFFTGDEEVAADWAEQDAVDAVEAVNDNLATAEPALPPTQSSKSSSPDSPPLTGFSSGSTSEVADSPAASMMPGDSAGLVRPRHLSPQFQRHIERNWQSTLSQGETGGERTLSAPLSSETTKRENSALSIGTRKVTSANDQHRGDYELQELIGQGSMGMVWSARQSSLDRNVAIKVPRPELASTGSLGENQFISEVVVTGKLEHPNIVPIYELGRDANGTPFYSMKHVQGRPWNEIIKEKSEQQNIEILMKVCDAIAFAHARDFLHRDIKPHNVIVGEFGEVSMMDWGIAISISKDPTLSWATAALGPAGTPAYMAPEMAAHNSSELGIVSDVYLLGAVLYEIVTGTPPHPRTSNTRAALLAAAANEITPTEKTGELIDIARRAMATEVDNRYQSVQDFQNALREYRSHSESISLCESANTHLSEAKRKGISDEFARARFAYQEAINLWPANAPAAKGLHDATLAYAANALEQGNYLLGLSILDPDEPDHSSLFARLSAKQQARQRRDLQNKVLGYSVALLLAFLAIGGVFTAVYLNVKRNEALAQKTEATAARETALEEKSKAGLAQLRAEQAQLLAEKSQLLTEKSRGTAVVARDYAKVASLRAEEASYRSEIGLAAESIRRNSFDKAREIVATLDTGVKSSLRHWEWAYLQHLLSKSSLRQLPELNRDERVESIAVANVSTGDPDNKAAGQHALVIVAATDRGVRVWRQGIDNDSPPKLSDARDGFSAQSVAVTSDGRYVIAGVTTEDPRRQPIRQYALKVWKLIDGKLVENGSIGNQTATVHSVAFSGDAGLVLTGSADRKARLWDFAKFSLQEPQLHQDFAPSMVFDDHAGDVWSVQFSQDNSRLVTACEDGRVRVWTTTGEQLADFTGHKGPVYSAAFLDRDRVVSGGSDRRLLAWRLNLSPAEFREYRGVAVTNAVNANDDRISPYQEQEIGRHDASIRCLRVAGDPKFIFSGGHDNSLKIWQDPTNGLSSQRAIRTLRGHGRWVRACGLSADGKYLVSGGYDGGKVWDWKKYENPQTLVASFADQIGDRLLETVASEVRSATYSPDGKWIASALKNGDVAIWDMTSPRQTSANRLGGGHRFLTSHAAFYLGGKSLMTSAGDNTTRLWDVDRCIQTKPFVGTGWRGVATISEDGRLLLTGSDDKQVPARLWGRSDDLWTEISLAEAFLNRDGLQGRSETTAVALSDHGRYGFIGDSGGNGMLFSIEPETQRVSGSRDLAGNAIAVNAAKFLPTQQLLTAGDDGLLRKWELPEAKQIEKLSLGGAIRSVAVSANGRLALAASFPAMRPDAPHPWNQVVVRLINIDTMTVLEQLTLEEIDPESPTPPIVQSVAFSPDDSFALLTVYYPDRNRKHELAHWHWQRPTDKIESLSSASWGELSTATFRPVAESASQLLTVGGKGARLWDVNNQTRVAPIPVAVFRQQSTARLTAFSPDSRRMIVAGGDATATVWELDGQDWREDFKLTGLHDREVVAVMFDPHSADRVLTAGPQADAGAGKVVIWERDADNGRWSPQYQWDTAGRPRCAVFSPDTDDESRMIIVGSDDRAERWNWTDILRGDFTSTTVIARPVHCAKFSSDGRWLITAGDSTAQIWSADDPDRGPLAQLTGHSGTITSVAVSKDRRRVLTGSNDFTVKLWDTDAVDNQDNFNQTSPITAVEKDGFASDGEMVRDIVSATGAIELLTLEQHDGGITSVAFSPDGRSVLTTGEDGRVIVETGESVPPSIMTGDQVSFAEGLMTGRVAPFATLQSPTEADFSNASLTVSIKKTAGSDGDSFRVALAGHTRDWNIRRDLGGPDDDETVHLVISPISAGTREAFQTLIRGIEYEYRQNGDSQDTIVQRQIVIRLTGVEYSQWDADRETFIRATFTPREAEVSIEIEQEPRIEIEPPQDGQLVKLRTTSQ